MNFKMGQFKDGYMLNYQPYFNDPMKASPRNKRQVDKSFTAGMDPKFLLTKEDLPMKAQPTDKELSLEKQKAELRKPQL